MIKTILDPCCGSKMFYFDKNNSLVLFCDIREIETTLCDGRKLEVKPDMICDFRNMPFPNESFRGVIFDPPHLQSLGSNSYLALKYGTLPFGEEWKDYIKKGFDECMRVLQKGCLLVFKWNEHEIPQKDLLAVLAVEPLMSAKSGRDWKTHFMVFVKT